jgi:hypothetical protein
MVKCDFCGEELEKNSNNQKYHKICYKEKQKIKDKFRIREYREYQRNVLDSMSEEDKNQEIEKFVKEIMR